MNVAELYRDTILEVLPFPRYLLPDINLELRLAIAQITDSTLAMNALTSDVEGFRQEYLTLVIAIQLKPTLPAQHDLQH